MRRYLLPVAVTASVLLAGCTGEPAGSPEVPSFSTSTTTPPTTTTTQLATLPANCGSVLASAQIDLVLDKPLVGKTNDIVGVPEPDIGRLERLTCRYGMPKKPKADDPVPLEVSVSRYVDEQRAAERLDATIEHRRANGAAPSEVLVGPAEGTVLVSGEERLLVAAHGSLTLAVSVGPGVVAKDRLDETLAELGGRVFTSLLGE